MQTHTHTHTHTEEGNQEEGHHVQGEEHLSHQKPGEAGHTLPEPLEGGCSADTWISDFWLPEHETIHFCYSKATWFVVLCHSCL
jgi:hypothetical protein